MAEDNVSGPAAAPAGIRGFVAIAGTVRARPALSWGRRWGTRAIRERARLAQRSMRGILVVIVGSTDLPAPRCGASVRSEANPFMHIVCHLTCWLVRHQSSGMARNATRRASLGGRFRAATMSRPMSRRRQVAPDVALSVVLPRRPRMVPNRGGRRATSGQSSRLAPGRAAAGPVRQPTSRATAGVGRAARLAVRRLGA